MSTSTKDTLLPLAVGCLIALSVIWLVGRLDHNRHATQAASHRAAVAQTQASQASARASTAAGATAILAGAERNTCQQVQTLSAVIQQVLRGQLKTLGRKGTPGYTYYRHHLDELAVARLQLHQEVAQFAPRRC